MRFLTLVAIVVALAGCAAEDPGSAERTSELRPAGGGLVSTWTDRTPQGDAGPPPLERVAMAYDGAKTVLYGGYDGSHTVGKTWEWTAGDPRGTWTNPTTSGGIGNLRDHAMAFFDGKVVIFGGRDDDDIAKDGLWKYDGGGAWSAVVKTGGPSARYGHAMAVTSDGLIVMGGRDDAGKTQQDTFRLTGLSESGVWADVTDPAGGGDGKPTVRHHHGMSSISNSSPSLLVYGGQGGNDTSAPLSSIYTSIGFAANKISWSPLGITVPAARTGIQIVWHENRQRGIMFGGDTSSNASGTYDDKTYLYTPGGSASFAELSTDTSPPGRAFYAATYDSERKTVLIFGGAPSRRDVWEFTSNTRPTITAANTSGAEQSPITVTVTASDPESSGNNLTLELMSVSPSSTVVPTFAMVRDNGTGDTNSAPGAIAASLTWTPGCNDHNTTPAFYSFVFKVTDGNNLSATDTSQVTVVDFNCKPALVFPKIDPFAEGSMGMFTVSATDPDDGQTLSLSMQMPVNDPRTPAVQPVFNTGSGLFTWTPGTSDADTYKITFRVTDNGTPGKQDEQTIDVIVNPVNVAPVVTAPATKTFTENVSDTILMTASDVDGDALTLLASITPVPPTTAPLVQPTFDTGTKTLTWKPGFLDDGTYMVTFSADDHHAPPVTATTMVTVLNSNRNPALVIAPSGTDKSVSETNLLTFTVTVSDPDTDDVKMVSATDLPAGATFTGNTFSWRPDTTQGTQTGQLYTVTFTGTDGFASVMTTVKITVKDVNRLPVITPITPKTVAEGGTLTFTVQATDPDEQTLVLSAQALPPGAVFNPLNGTFVWSPDCTAADVTGGTTEARFLVDDGIDAVELVVPITVTGTIVSVSPTSLSFPSTRVGSSSSPLSVTIKNGRPTGVQLTGAATAASVFSVAAGQLPRTIAGNGMTTVSVTFNPTSSTPEEAVLALTIDDPACSTITVPVTGLGQTAGVEVSRAGADFGPIRVGTTSDPASFTVKNSGEANFVISTIALAGNPDFILELVSPTVYPVTLKPGASVTFQVSALPTLVGLRSGTVNITTDIPGAGVTQLALRVTGVAPALQVSDLRLDFGSVDVQGTGSTKMLTLSNNGGVPLTVLPPSLTGPGAGAYRVEGAASGLTINPGGTGSFTIVYLPSRESSGEASASVQISSDALGSSSIAVMLAGRGVDRHATFMPPSVTFEDTKVGESKTATVTIGNSGMAPLKLGTPAVAIEGAGMAAYTVSSVTQTTIDGMGSTTVTVTFAPTAPGTLVADLVVKSDDSDKLTARVGLSGVATGKGPITPDGVDLHGGGLIGCQVGDGARGPAAGAWLPLLLVAGLLLRRRRAAAAVLVLAFAAVPAQADPATAFDLGVFRPQLMPGSALVTVERPSVLPANAIGASLTIDYGLHPLFAMQTSSGEESAAVSNRVATTLAAGYGLLGRAELYLAIPFLAQSGSSGMTDVVAASGVALGDLELGGRAVIVPDVAVSAGLTLPTGDASEYAGAESAGAQVKAVVGRQIDKLAFAGNLGVRLRFKEAQLGEIKQGHEIAYGAGGSYALADWGEALVELYGAVGLADAGSSSPLELLAAVRAWPAGSLAVTGGLGAGIISGIGAADLRLFVGVAYAPRDRRPKEVQQAEAEQAAADRPPPERPAPPEVPDTDGDGVVDPADRCPGQKEDRDGWEDGDGCPDPDNDGDGLLDGEDACATEAEVINGVKDEDGCPDKGDPGILVAKDRIELLAPVQFDGPMLRASSRPVVGQIAAALRAHAEIKHLNIAVHVHKRGSWTDDLKMSQRRAEAIRAYLVEKGISATRLSAEGYGSSRPLGKETVDRIELVITE